MKNCQQQNKSFRNAQRHASCFTAPMCQKSLSGHIRLYCKRLIASRTNRVAMHGLRASCSSVPLCHNLLSGQIRSYCKKLIASRTNCIVIPLRRCVRRRLPGQIRSYWRRGVLCVSLRRCVIIGYFRNSCFNCALLEYYIKTFSPIVLRAQN